MADTVTPDVRSRMMAGIRAKDTKPEMLIRRGLHAHGFRFRLHDRKLSGCPDLVFPKHRAVIFVHGCFWHGHDCHLFRLPATRQEWWTTKINRNREVDARSEQALAGAGWRLGVVWECALKGRTRLPFMDVLEACRVWLRTDMPRLEIRGTA
jgi:DNA mismatch endonuclease (patch repair protein)